MGIVPVQGGPTTHGHNPVSNEKESQSPAPVREAELTIDDYDIRSSELARRQRAAVTVEPRQENSAWWGHCNETPAPNAEARYPGGAGGWNYPLEKGEVIKLDGPPVGFDTSTLPAGGNVTFYRTHFSYTAETASPNSGKYGQEKIAYEFWIQRDDAGRDLDSGWVQKRDTPDFIWAPKEPK